MLKDRIRGLRRSRGLTLTQVAEHFGISAASVSSWERGVNHPDPRRLQSLADFFRVPLSSLLGEHAGQEPPPAKALATSTDWDVPVASVPAGQSGQSESAALPFYRWSQLHLPVNTRAQEALLSTSSCATAAQLSAQAFFTRLPSPESLNWQAGPVPAGALLVVDPSRAPREGSCALVVTPGTSVELARYCSSGSSGSWQTVGQCPPSQAWLPLEVRVLGVVVEWSINSILD
jgi:transcriptional regulator with XRE-family HTH domain